MNFDAIIDFMTIVSMVIFIIVLLFTIADTVKDENKSNK